MAEVYAAQDLRHHREVAVKVLKPEFASAIAAERFLREVEIAAHLTHPHILPVYDSGEIDGLPYYVMPLVVGETLGQRLSREKQLPIEDAIGIAVEVAEALDHAHSRGIVHRDVKPDNILLEKSHARVADFGVASAVAVAGGERLTDTGIAVGTPLYMSPEQAAGEREIDARSDIYSLGCVLYEMLGGEPPFLGASVQAVFAKKATQEVPPLRAIRDAVSPALDRVIRKALRRSPVDRFASAEEFARALRRCERATDEVEFASDPYRTLRRALLFAVVFGGLALGVAFAARNWGGTFLAPEAKAVHAIAVLPILADSSQVSLADDIHSRLIDELSHIRALRVTGVLSSMQYRGTRKLAPVIAEELDVDALVESSARIAGDSVYVHVRLIGAAAGKQLWARQFTAGAGHLDGLQKMVIREIATYLQLSLTTEERARLGSYRVVDPRANEEYRRGVRLAASSDPDRFHKSIAAFEEAIRLDPADPSPMVALADLYSGMGLGHDTMPAAEAYRLAKLWAQRALQIDPREAEAHAALGDIMSKWDWDWAGAEREFKLAVESNPGSAFVHNAYAGYLRSLGLGDSSIAEHQRARRIDPFARLPDLAVSYLWAGRPDSAIKWARDGVDLDPGSPPAHWALGAAFMMLGQHDSSIVEHRRAAELNPQFRAHLAQAYAAAGQVEDFERLVASLNERDKRRLSLILAQAYATRGDREAAFHWLDIAYKDHFPWISTIRGEPAFRSLSSDPRYRDLLRRLGLPPR